MQPPVEIRDRSEYKRRMNELLKLDPRRTVDEFKSKVQAARVLEPVAAR